MPHIKFSDKANTDLDRFEDFLLETAPEKVDEAIKTIFQGLKILKENAFVGTPQQYGFRKLVIPYGKNGYVAIYKYDDRLDLIVIETIRHMRELEPDFFRLK